MNIMEIASATGINGAQVHCMMLTRELARRGHRVSLVCHPDSWIRTQVDPEAVNIIPSDLHRYPIDELRRIAALVREHDIHAIHTHMSRAHFFGVLLKLFWGVRCVATAHSCHFQPHWMFNDRVIAVSDFTRRYHRFYNSVPGKRIQVVHNFIDLGRFSKTTEDGRRRMRESFGIGASTLLIGAFGHVTEQKGMTYLAKAMKKVAIEVPEARLLLVGNGQPEYVSALKSEAGEEHIVWAGYRSDVPEIMGALDLQVSASLSENFPISMIEAMASGLPIVATSVGGVPECVIDGTNGILVPPRNSDSLAEAIIRLLKNEELRKKFADAGRKRALEEFSPEAQVPRIEEILRKAAGLGPDRTPPGNSRRGV